MRESNEGAACRVKGNFSGFPHSSSSTFILSTFLSSLTELADLSLMISTVNFSISDAIFLLLRSLTIRDAKKLLQCLHKRNPNIHSSSGCVSRSLHIFPSITCRINEAIMQITKHAVWNEYCLQSS